MFCSYGILPFERTERVLIIFEVKVDLLSTKRGDEDKRKGLRYSN